MLRTLGQIMICLAMFALIGGHWAVLQSVAWGTMIANYSKSSSLASAVQETFSGKKPCRLCHVVEEGRKQENNTPATFQADKKIEKFLSRPVAALKVPRSEDQEYPRPADEMALRVPFAPADPVPIGACPFEFALHRAFSNSIA